MQAAHLPPPPLPLSSQREPEPTVFTKILWEDPDTKGHTFLRSDLPRLPRGPQTVRTHIVDAEYFLFAGDYIIAGAEFDLVAYMTAHYFGLRQYGRINGVLFAGVIAGGALGPMLFGFTFDAFGSYAPILAGATLVFIGTAVAQLFIASNLALTPTAEARL